MSDLLQRLLMSIVEHPIMRDENREAELDASAVQDVPSEIEKIDQRTREDAERLGPYFARGLRMARNGPLVVDDTTPEGNGIAEAFARYLVAPNLATSQSTTLADNHFRYTFEVDWDRIRQIAQAEGINLDEALASQAGTR